MKKILFLSSVILFSGFLFVFTANAEELLAIVREDVRLERRVQERLELQTNYSSSSEDQGLQIKNQNQEQVQARLEPIMAKLGVTNVEELKSLIEERRNELKEELKQFKKSEQETLKKQNAVREAVHALLSAEELTGGIGPQVSAIAREFDNSVQKTVSAEVKIRNRSPLQKFFIGGDTESAEVLSSEVNFNKGRLESLYNLQDKCVNCSDDLKALIAEHLQKMETEQQRLLSLSEQEKSAKGLFGWFNSLFKK